MFQSFSDLNAVAFDETAWPDYKLQRWLPTLSTLRFVRFWHPYEEAGKYVFLGLNFDPSNLYIDLGEPIHRLEVRITDLDDRDCPPGAFGRLQFADTKSGKEWRPTGFRARSRDGKRFELSGRPPESVFHHGFLVELGLVENALLCVPVVEEALIRKVEDKSGSPFLAAWVVATDTASIHLPDLWRHLESLLPDFVIPNGLAVVDRLPIDETGNPDPGSLTLPKPRQVKQVGQAPTTPVEEIVSLIWSRALERESLSLSDNFFDLGGQSLTATRVVSEIDESFSIDYPLKHLFLGPTIRQMAQRIEQLLQEKQGKKLPPIGPMPQGQDMPLSFAQQRLWFLDKLDGATTAYNIPATLRLRGSLDCSAIERALQSVVRRHEALRTTFLLTEGRASQVIHPESKENAVVLDLRYLEDPVREKVLEQLVTADAIRHFSLEEGPLLSMTLARLAVDDYVLMLNIHHIVSDAWSTGILIKELVTFYNADLHSQVAVLPELSIQYRDFSWWQQQHLAGDVLTAQRDYWKKRLTGAPELLNLPTDRPRPSIQTFNGATLSFGIDAATLRALKEIGRHQNTTLFMSLLAVFHAFLYRYTGQNDLTIGAPIANRNNKQIESLIGFFVNMLVFRAQCDADIDFTRFLADVRNNAMDAYSNQDIPFEQVVEAVCPQRDLSRSPLFQVMLSLTNIPLESLNLSCLELVPFIYKKAIAKYDLSLTITETSDQLLGVFEYNTDLFDAVTVEAMIGHFTCFLENVLDRPTTPLSEIEMLSSQHKVELHRLWMQNQDQIPLEHPRFLAVFARAVVEQPGKIVVSYRTTRLTYSELDNRANRLAAHLQRKGVRIETPVGLMLPRSCDLLIGILGILRAGGMYVPMDASHPMDRLQEIINQTHMPVVVTQTAHTEMLSAWDVQPVCLDRQEGFPTMPPIPFDHGNLSNQAAYVIFTSGTTGKPKGVVVDHSSLALNIHAWQHAYRLDQLRCHLQIAKVTFDVFSGDMIRALSSGAQLVLCPRETLLNPAELFTTMRREGVDFAEFVPAIIRVFMSYLKEENLSLDFMKILVIGSDNWLIGEYRRLKSLCGPHTRIINSYGITETTIDNTLYEADDLDLADGGSTPIGKPMRNHGLYIFNNALVELPIQVTGELFIGGATVARGYWRNPRLTAQRFIPDPIVKTPGSRMYRSGDAARYSRSGQIEFFGRLDHQIKLRGYRIEPNEISAVLERHEAVQFAFTMLREDRPGYPCLVSYAQLTQEQNPDDRSWSNLLKVFARERLAEYMVPASIVTLAEIPLNANGKLDRSALPSVDFTGEDVSFVPPETPIEVQLAFIWKEVLNCSRIGRHDTFFALGGHSLLAIQVIARIRKQFSIEFPLQELFAFSDLHRQSKRIGETQATRSVSKAPVLRRVDRTRVLPLSFAQKRLWFIEKMGHAGTAYGMPISIRFKGKLNAVALSASIDAILLRHEALRTVFPIVSGEPCQHILDHEPFQLPLVDLTRLPKRRRIDRFKELVKRDAHEPFDLVEGPLFRTYLVEIEGEDHGLLINMHHIVSDGWSIGLFMTELTTHYKAHVIGKPALLPELTVQYADYAYAQQEWLCGDVLKDHENFWREMLEEAPVLLNLPLDRPRPVVQSSNGSSVGFDLDADLTRKLKSFAVESESTLFMTLYTFFTQLLSLYSGQTDLVIGTPVANRDLPEVESLIGFFVNSVPLRADLSGHPSLRQLSSRVRANTLASFDHGSFPFEKMVEIIQPTRNTSHSPLFQVMIVLQNTPTSNVMLPSLRLVPMPQKTYSAKFDLIFAIQELSTGLRCSFNYNTDLFEEKTIQRMAAHLSALIENGLEQADLPLARVPILSDAESFFLLETCNDTAVPFSQDMLIDECFQEQAVLSPRRVALSCSGVEITYEELNQRAEILAAVLCGRGVKPESKVALCIPPSIEVIVAILGVLKAGGAYVPLDQTYPPDRLRTIVADAGVEILLVKQDFPGLGDGITKICLDTLPKRPHRAVTPHRGTAAMSAYIMYTSGSTGKPKGVVVTHRNVIRLVSNPNYVGIHREDRFLLAASIAFDASTFEIWGCLLNGAYLEILPAQQLQELPQFIVNRNISILWMTAQLFHTIVDDHLDCLARVSQLLAGGDALSLPHVHKVLDRYPKMHLINGYGPTEGTTFSSCCDLRRQDVSPHYVSIGSPISNTTAYVVDADLNLAPVGVFGELLIGGEGLARGYLNRPALTAQKFIPNPFKYDGRLYRSGDLVRRLSNGLLYFAGRIDRQVKIRGYRIEPGEIEQAMIQHPDVRDAVVRIVSSSSDKQLVAYLMAEDTLETDDLRKQLLSKLPKYMLPSVFVTMAKFPVTPNGKLDTRALPLPDRDTVEYEPTQSRTEEMVARIWAELLGVEKVGRNANFFELGGHSLMAARAISRLQKDTGLSIAIQALFQNPVVEEFAAYLDLTLWSARAADRTEALSVDQEVGEL